MSKWPGNMVVLSELEFEGDVQGCNQQTERRGYRCHRTALLPQEESSICCFLSVFTVRVYFQLKRVTLKLVGFLLEVFKHTLDGYLTDSLDGYLLQVSGSYGFRIWGHLCHPQDLGRGPRTFKVLSLTPWLFWEKCCPLNMTNCILERDNLQL